MSGNQVSEIPKVPQDPHPNVSAQGRLHRVSRLMALAIKCDGLIRSQVLRDYTDIAKLGRISKPRVTQIMNLLNLAPDIQEHLLFLPPTTSCRDRISERHLRGITKLVDWNEQRKLFPALCAALSDDTDVDTQKKADPGKAAQREVIDVALCEHPSDE
jgi:hypothetical protein